MNVNYAIKPGLTRNLFIGANLMENLFVLNVEMNKKINNLNIKII